MPAEVPTVVAAGALVTMQAEGPGRRPAEVLDGVPAHELDGGTAERLTVASERVCRGSNKTPRWA